MSDKERWPADLAVPGSISAGSENLHIYIAHNLSLSSCHLPGVVEILLKRKQSQVSEQGLHRFACRNFIAEKAKKNYSRTSMARTPLGP